jgi:hypothetical protein
MEQKKKRREQRKEEKGEEEIGKVVRGCIFQGVGGKNIFL